MTPRRRNKTITQLTGEVIQVNSHHNSVTVELNARDENFAWDRYIPIRISLSETSLPTNLVKGDRLKITLNVEPA